jgi:hypothetical protein
MAAEVGGRGEGIMGVGVVMEEFFGVEVEYGLEPLGVAMLLAVFSSLFEER